MSMSWQCLDSGPRSARDNMELDRALLEACAEESEPLLHLYDWQGDAATYGHFVDPFKLLKKEVVEREGLDLGKRPTGGGIIFHTSDLAFSVLVPASSSYFSENTLDNYAFVNQRVIAAISQMKGVKGQLLQNEPTGVDEHSRHFCMAKPTKYDVMIEGKKVGGAAQRKTRFGFLHQGSISLRPLNRERFGDIFVGDRVFENMCRNSFTLLGDAATDQEFLEARLELKDFLKKAFSDEGL